MSRGGTFDLCSKIINAVKPEAVEAMALHKSMMLYMELGISEMIIEEDFQRVVKVSNSNEANAQKSTL